MVFFTSDSVNCDVHQINGGVEEATVIGNNATVMFEGTGPSVDNVVTDFEIEIQMPPGVNVGGVFLCSGAATSAPSQFGVTCSVDDGMAITVSNEFV